MLSCDSFVDDKHIRDRQIIKMKQKVFWYHLSDFCISAYLFQVIC